MNLDQGMAWTLGSSTVWVLNSSLRDELYRTLSCKLGSLARSAFGP